MGRYILHIDQNCFYASVEMQRHPELRNKPLAVCGRQDERHGIVLAANYLYSQALWRQNRYGYLAGQAALSPSGNTAARYEGIHPLQPDGPRNL